MKQRFTQPLLWYAFLEDCLRLTLIFFALCMAIELLLPGFLSERFPLSLLFLFLLCLLGLQIMLRERLALSVTPQKLPRLLHPLSWFVFFAFFVLANFSFGYIGIILQIPFFMALIYLLYQTGIPRQK